jgi:peptide/nickel transport system permease protein
VTGAPGTAPPRAGHGRSRRVPRAGTAGLAAVAAKLVTGLLTVVLASVVVFLAVEVLPRDPARTALGNESTAAQREAFRHQYGLDDPPIQRYARWAGRMVRGDFGESIISGRPIARELWPRLGRTALLALLAVLISVAVGVPLAVRAARRPGGALDTAANLVSTGLSSVPEFVLGLVLVYLVASRLHLLPVLSNRVDQGQWSGLVLPALTLGLAAVSYVFRFARVGVVEVAGAPFVRAARLRGFSERRLTWRHVLPVAGSAVVNVVALNAIYLLGGVIVIENLFAYPGLGTLLLGGVRDNDLPTIEAVAVVTAALLVAINFAADVAVTLLNPRLRHRSGA